MAFLLGLRTRVVKRIPRRVGGDAGWHGVLRPRGGCACRHFAQDDSGVLRSGALHPPTVFFRDFVGERKVGPAGNSRGVGDVESVGGFGSGSGVDVGMRVHAKAACVAEHEGAGELRVGDHAGGMRCEDESAEVQERAGDVSKGLRGNCGGEVNCGYEGEWWRQRRRR